MNNVSKLRAGILLVGGFGLALIVGVAFGPMFEAPPRSKTPQIAPSKTNTVKAARPHVQIPGGHWPNQAQVMANAGCHFANLRLRARRGPLQKNA